MAGSRGRYPPEYKEQIVELVRSGRSPGSLAREFEPSEQTDGGEQADLDEGLRSDPTEARLELLRLREVKRLRMERDILWFGGRATRSPAGVRVHEQAGHVSACGHVPGAGSLPQRVLRLARARRDIELQGKILLELGRQRGDLWLPSDPRELERVSRMARLMRDLGIQGVIQDGDDAEGREGPACARPGEPQLPTGPTSCGSPITCTHLGWLAVPRGRAGCLHRRLGDGSAHAGRTCRGRVAISNRKPKAGGASFRARSIRRFREECNESDGLGRRRLPTRCCASFFVDSSPSRFRPAEARGEVRLHRGFYNTRRIHSALGYRRRTSRDSTMRPEATVQRRGNRSAPDFSWLFASSVMYVGNGGRKGTISDTINPRNQPS